MFIAGSINSSILLRSAVRRLIGVDGTTGFGNLGRNPFRGPFQQNWDVSIGKNFRITENKNFKFAADFFNIWNHPIFASPNSIFNGLGFGTITSTRARRV